MSKEKQIEEMAKIIDDNHGFIVSSVETAEALYTADYRKASDLAEEIFAEIEKEIEFAIDNNYRAKKVPNYGNFNAMCDGKIYAMRELLDFMEELKKKYESEKDK